MACFSDKEIAEAKDRLCKNCRGRDQEEYPLRIHCHYNLVPITSKGEDCPYYQYWTGGDER